LNVLFVSLSIIEKREEAPISENTAEKGESSVVLNHYQCTNLNCCVSLFSSTWFIAMYSSELADYGTCPYRISARVD